MLGGRSPWTYCCIRSETSVGPDDFEWRWYWAVDAVGLDRAAAERLASVAGELDGVLGASPVDPRDCLLIRWDRATTEDVWRRLGESPSEWPDNLRDGIGGVAGGHGRSIDIAGLRNRTETSAGPRRFRVEMILGR